MRASESWDSNRGTPCTSVLRELKSAALCCQMYMDHCHILHSSLKIQKDDANVIWQVKFIFNVEAKLSRCSLTMG